MSGDKVMTELVALRDVPVGITFTRLMLVLEKVKCVKEAEVKV